MTAPLGDDNKTVSGLWGCKRGEALSNMERLCIHSFCKNGHNFRLYAYEEISNLPVLSGGGKLEVCDAAEILPKSEIFVNHGSLAEFADMFRWELLRQRGGWYVDMDVVCLRPFDFSNEIVFGRDPGLWLAAHVLKFPASHPLTAGLAHACAHPNKTMPWDDKARRRAKTRWRLRFWRDSRKKQRWGESGGPEGLTFAARHFGIENLAKPLHYFAPLHGAHWREMTDESLRERGMLAQLFEHSYAIHFVNTWWTRAKLDKNGEYAANSPFESLKRIYLPECATGGAIAR